jgi:AcrR family transcriptional regulator
VNEPGTGSIGRERRTSAEVRTALLNAAPTLFARHGLARTTTREIAEAAGVAETALFRHFGSKSELFAEAVVAPFARFAEQYAQRWWPRLEQPAPNEDILRAFLEDFYDELESHRDAVRALLLAYGDPSAAEAVNAGRGHFAELYRSLTALAEAWSSRSEGMAPVFTDALTSRFIVGMLMLFTTFDWWFVPPGEQPVGREQVIDVMAGIVIPGLSGHRRTEPG